MAELSLAERGRPASLAFYLPQFHPVPENDEWWGPGFTEWRNVVRAAPRFPGHEQPQLPADLGFYDLREPTTRQAQADLAAAHGIDGFVYYHYWFNGRRILERPLAEVLASGRPDFPFAVCWANENWSRRWDGSDSEVLLEQHYSPADDVAFLESLLPLLTDPRYVRLHDRPVLFLYRAALLPDCAATVRRWREVAAVHGLDLFVVLVESLGVRYDAAELGADAVSEFQPTRRSLGPRVVGGRGRRVLGRLGAADPWRRDAVFDYPRLVEGALAEPAQPGRFRCVAPGWDNSPRRATGARIVRGSTPALYEDWVRRALAAGTSDLLMVNAWNEWAEGAHLEPDLRWGRAYLEAHRRAVGAP